MRKIAFLLFVICFGCNPTKDNELPKQSIDSGFVDFINQFVERSLPDSFTISYQPAVTSMSFINKEYVIDSYANIKGRSLRTNTFEGGSYPVGRYVFSNKAKFIVYKTYEMYPCEEKHVLATYDNIGIIDKAIIHANDYNNYNIQTWINRDGILNVIYFYDKINTHENTLSNYPDHRFVNVVAEKYEVLSNGKIEFIEVNFSETFIAKKNGYEYEYPINIKGVKIPLRKYDLELANYILKQRGLLNE